MIPALAKLIQEIEVMLPLYRKNDSPGVQKAVGNIEWNLKKVRGNEEAEPMDVSTWLQYTRSDFAQIAGKTSNEEAGGKFAAEFDERSAGLADELAHGGADASSPDPVPAPESASTPSGDQVSPPQGGAHFDLTGLLKSKEAVAGENLQWETSIVDLLKLLGLDSSLGGRKKIAAAIGMKDEEINEIGSGSGNSNLHGKLMAHLAASQGELPRV